MKAKTLCSDCNNYVPNGKVCECHMKKPTKIVKSLLGGKEYCIKHNLNHGKKYKSCYNNPFHHSKRQLKHELKRSPFSDRGIGFSSEIDPYEIVNKPKVIVKKIVKCCCDYERKGICKQQGKHVICEHKKKKWWQFWK